MDRIFIIWGREAELSGHLAQAFSARAERAYIKKIGKFALPAGLRYLIQGGRTLKILLKHRPRLVIAQNPPVFAPLLAWVYCFCSGAKLYIDSHTAAFVDKKWVFFHRLFKFVAKRADLNSCHNYKNLELLRQWGVKPAMVMPFCAPEYDWGELSRPMADAALEKRAGVSLLPVMMVNRFAVDDDWRVVVETARVMPEADFFITGDCGKSAEAVKGAPGNVCFTGYLEHGEFLKLMRHCKVVIALTTRRDTLLWSIREAMALRKPFITTDSEVLRHYYGEAGLFAEHNPERIKEKILQAVAGEKLIAEKINVFLKKDKAVWQEKIKEAKGYLNIKSY